MEADAKAVASDWEGRGHRKLAELGCVGVGQVAAGSVSGSTMHRVVARDGLSLRAKCAGARRETVLEPPQPRDGLWQVDFTENETDAAGIWNLGVGGEVEVCLCCDRLADPCS